MDRRPLRSTRLAFRGLRYLAGRFGFDVCRSERGDANRVAGSERVCGRHADEPRVSISARITPGCCVLKPVQSYFDRRDYSAKTEGSTAVASTMDDNLGHSNNVLY